MKTFTHCNSHRYKDTTQRDNTACYLSLFELHSRVRQVYTLDVRHTNSTETFPRAVERFHGFAELEQNLNYAAAVSTENIPEQYKVKLI